MEHWSSPNGCRADCPACEAEADIVNAGCDSCGTFDREENSKFCKACGEENLVDAAKPTGRWPTGTWMQQRQIILAQEKVDELRRKQYARAG